MSDHPDLVRALEALAKGCEEMEHSLVHHESAKYYAAEIKERIRALLREHAAPVYPYSGQCDTCGHLYTELMMAHLHEEDHPGHTAIEDYAAHADPRGRPRANPPR